jgi:glycosyltransferase involved in cell wall biosynthesis
VSLRLSIITINLNNNVGLKKTIESVISQTFANYEFIVIDGASKDGSVEIIKQFSDKISYWISEPDNGIYHAMNKGIFKAKGEYCLFLNSGDYLYSIHILDEVFLMGYTDDIISGEVETFSYKHNKSETYSNFSTKNNTFYDFINSSPNHQATFIRRKLFDEYGLYDENKKMVSDYIFFIKAVGLGKASFRFIKKTISFYNSDGLSLRYRKASIDEQLKALEDIVPPLILDDYKTGYIKYMRTLNKYAISRFLHKLLFILTYNYMLLMKRFIK